MCDGAVRANPLTAVWKILRVGLVRVSDGSVFHTLTVRGKNEYAYAFVRHWGCIKVFSFFRLVYLVGGEILGGREMLTN